MREMRNLSFQIISLLKNKSNLTLTDISSKLGIKYENIKKAVINLEQKNIIVKKRENGKLIIKLNNNLKVF